MNEYINKGIMKYKYKNYIGYCVSNKDIYVNSMITHNNSKCHIKLCQFKSKIKIIITSIKISITLTFL